MCGHTLVIGWSLSISLSEAKSLKDDATLESEGLDDGGVLYFKDLGPQIGWKTVGLQESYNIPTVAAWHRVVALRNACAFWGRSI